MLGNRNLNWYKPFYYLHLRLVLSLRFLGGAGVGVALGV